MHTTVAKVAPAEIVSTHCVVFDVPYQNTRRLTSQSFSLQVLVHAFYYSQSILKSLAESKMQFGSKNTGYKKQEEFLFSDLLTHNKTVDNMSQLCDLFVDRTRDCSPSG